MISTLWDLTLNLYKLFWTNPFGDSSIMESTMAISRPLSITLNLMDEAEIRQTLNMKIMPDSQWYDYVLNLDSSKPDFLSSSKITSFKGPHYIRVKLYALLTSDVLQHNLEGLTLVDSYYNTEFEMEVLEIIEIQNEKIAKEHYNNTIKNKACVLGTSHLSSLLLHSLEPSYSSKLSIS